MTTGLTDTLRTHRERECAGALCADRKDRFISYNLSPGSGFGCVAETESGPSQENVNSSDIC